MSNTNRRSTLGPLSSSTLNSRMSLGPSRMQDSKPSRMSLSGTMVNPTSASNSNSNNRLSILATSRKSISIQQQQQQPRTSSISSASRLPDPRNIGEKQFMNNSIRQLIEYLASHGFDGAVSPKILSKPTNKDFMNIVLFLFRQFDPNYKFTGKFEDEMITMYKYLGYPFPIAKSNISAVGSPHAWPTLLGCIMWLVELLLYNEVSNNDFNHNNNGGIDDEQVVRDENDPSSSEKGFYRYLGKAYEMFLSGKDDQYAQLEEQFIQSFENKNILIRDQIDAFDKRNAALTSEIEEVKNRSLYLPELIKKKKEFQVNYTQFHVLIEELKKHRNQLKEKNDNKQSELASLQTNITNLQSDINIMNQKILNQDLSPEDVRNMVNERQRLEEAYQLASESRNASQQRIKDLEATLRTKVQQLEESAAIYQSYAEGLKLVPSSARNARGLELGIEIDIRAKNREGLLKSDIRNQIVPILQQMRGELNETTLSLRSEHIQEQEQFDEVEAQKNELMESMNENEEKIRRAELSYKREKELFDQNMAMHSKELDMMEARLVQLRDTAVEEAKVTAAKRRIAEAMHMRGIRKTEHERKKAAMIEMIMDVVSQCAGHRESVQSQLEDLKSQYTYRLDLLLSAEPLHKDSYPMIVNSILSSQNTANIKEIEFLTQYLPRHEHNYSSTSMNHQSHQQQPIQQYQSQGLGQYVLQSSHNNNSHNNIMNESAMMKVSPLTTNDHTKQGVAATSSNHNNTSRQSSSSSSSMQRSSATTPFSHVLDFNQIYPQDSTVKEEENETLNLGDIITKLHEDENTEVSIFSENINQMNNPRRALYNNFDQCI